MEISTLELQLQNNIIMFARPTYPYIADIEPAYDYKVFKKIIADEVLEIMWAQFEVIDIAYNIIQQTT